MNFITAQAAASRARRKLLQIEIEHPSAHVQGKTECCQSGVCCWRRPGELTEADVPKIAEHLGLTTRELFEKKLCVDSIDGVLVLLPVRRHQEEDGSAGTFLTAAQTYEMDSPCTFLGDDNRCQIHSVKPEPCRRFKCWDPDPDWKPTPFDREALIALGWDGWENTGEMLSAFDQ